MDKKAYSDIEVVRPSHQQRLCEDVVKEFARRGYIITIDQAHCLLDLIYWADHGNVYRDVEEMIAHYVSFKKP